MGRVLLESADLQVDQARLDFSMNPSETPCTGARHMGGLCNARYLRWTTTRLPISNHKVGRLYAKDEDST